MILFRTSYLAGAASRLVVGIGVGKRRRSIPSFFVLKFPVPFSVRQWLGKGDILYDGKRKSPHSGRKKKRG